MKKHFHLFLLLSCSLLFTGCFEIIEEISYNTKKKNGTYKMLFDMSQSMDMIMSMMGTQSQKSPTTLFDTIPNPFTQQVTEFSSLQGISEVKEIRDTEKYVLGFEFKFANIESLNTALNANFKETYKADEKSLYVADKRSFKRLANQGKTVGKSLDELLSEEAMGKEEAEKFSMESAKMLLKDATYTTIYHFDRKVKSVGNEKSVIEADGKTVRTTYSLLEDDDLKLENDIKLGRKR